MADTLRPSIPLYHLDECVGSVLLSLAESNPHRYTIRRNKRHHATCAVLRGCSLETDLALRRNWRSRHGRSYEQPLPNGHVWALRGVRGSGR